MGRHGASPVIPMPAPTGMRAARCMPPSRPSRRWPERSSPRAWRMPQTVVRPSGRGCPCVSVDLRPYLPPR